MRVQSSLYTVWSLLSVELRYFALKSSPMSRRCLAKTMLRRVWKYKQLQRIPHQFSEKMSCFYRLAFNFSVNTTQYNNITSENELDKNDSTLTSNVKVHTTFSICICFLWSMFIVVHTRMSNSGIINLNITIISLFIIFSRGTNKSFLGIFTCYTAQIRKPNKLLILQKNVT